MPISNEARRFRYHNDDAYRKKILDRANLKYKKFRERNPVKKRERMSHEEHRAKTNARRRRHYWERGGRQQLMDVRNTDEYRRKENEKNKRKWKSDPAYRDRKLRLHKKWFYKKLATDPVFLYKFRLRDRIKKAVDRAILSGRSTRSEDSRGANFLVWLSKDIPKDTLCNYHIDHIIPVSLFDSQDVPYGVNDPENVRWMHKRHNVKKSNKMPSSQVIAKHIKKVIKWRTENE